ncbi:hypothetical protein DAI22_11g045500 [Oryza sativa Japonica Group]|nr:hypothetical protein DAI22_11g045500 [Oryza sativa Japonica Group]
MPRQRAEQPKTHPNPPPPPYTSQSRHHRPKHRRVQHRRRARNHGKGDHNHKTTKSSPKPSTPPPPKSTTTTSTAAAAESATRAQPNRGGEERIAPSDWARLASLPPPPLRLCNSSAATLRGGERREKKRKKGEEFSGGCNAEETGARSRIPYVAWGYGSPRGAPTWARRTWAAPRGEILRVGLGGWVVRIGVGPWTGRGEGFGGSGWDRAPGSRIRGPGFSLPPWVDCGPQLSVSLVVLSCTLVPCYCATRVEV